MMNILVQVSLIILLVLIVSFIMKLLKQPLIIGYILTGILVGPFVFNFVQDTTTIQLFSQFGVAFLLFIVGLGLNPKIIKEVGPIAVITGLGQIIFTSVIGYFIGIGLGFSPVEAIYIAIALTFSSTIIMMKLLSDKDALDKLYGKIARGFLLTQDLVALIILIFVSSASNGGFALQAISQTFLKGVLCFAILIPLSIYTLPKLENTFAKSQELLFLFALAWGLGLSALFFYIGFSFQMGALIAGVLLSISPYSHEISSKMKPLRDFFIISFFLVLGAQMVFSQEQMVFGGDLTQIIFALIIFSLFILIGNPLIVIAIMGALGYSKRTGFMSGLTVAQISEFSLILVTLGVAVGHLTDGVLSFVTMIGLFTIAGSTYLVMYSEKIYPLFSRMLSIFEKKHVKDKETIIKDYDYILLGYNRIGFSILNSFKELKKNYIVVDYNPETIKALSKRKIKSIYGDIDDVDFLDDLKIQKAKILVSTIPEIETNLLVTKKIRETNKDSIVITTARQIEDAFKLYKVGADYVILPHFLGGEYTSELIKKAKTNKSSYEKEKSKQIEELKARIREGQKHPEIARK